MHLELEEIALISGVDIQDVIEICGDINVADGGRVGLLYFYYVWLVGALLEWCKLDAIKESIPFTAVQPMMERMKTQMVADYPPGNACIPVAVPPAAAMQVPETPHAYVNYPNPTVYPNAEKCMLCSTKETWIQVHFDWRLIVFNAREALLKWLLEQREKMPLEKT